MRFLHKYFSIVKTTCILLTKSKTEYINEIIFTSKGDPLKLESKISEALDDSYAFLADRKSIDGYNRLTDELDQHDS